MAGTDAQYDNTAFTFFLLTGLFIFISLSGLYSAIRLYLALFRSKVQPDKARSAAETARLKKLAAEKRSCKGIFTKCFTINLVLLAGAVIVAVALVNSVDGSDVASVFDPFEILGVDTSATPREIKSAYRKLSLLYHPDKNPGDKAAEEMFIQITKAHQALTDEVARENYEKYGNPDGKQSTQVSIGLPTWLLDKDRTNIVIFGYLTFIALVCAFVCWCNRNGGQQSSTKVFVESERCFIRSLLKCEKPSQNIHDVFLLAHEFRKPKARPAGTAPAGQLADMLKKEFGVNCDSAKVAAIDPREVQGVEKEYCHQRAILQAYLHRIEVPAASDVAFMFSWLDRMVDSMVRVLHIDRIDNAPRFIIGAADRRLAVAKNVVEFAARCVQAIADPHRQALEQLPHLDSDEFKESRRKRKPVSLRAFLEAPEEKRQRILEALTDDQQQETMAVAEALPLLSAEVTALVEDSRAKNGEIWSGKDILTIKVEAERNYLDETIEAPPPVHAPLYPTVKKERWFALVLVSPRAAAGRRGRKTVKSKKAELRSVLLMQPMIEDEDTHKLKFERKFPAPPPSKFDVSVTIVCDAYVGLDVTCETNFVTVAPPAEAPVSRGGGGGHGHSHGGQACHGHGEAEEVKDYVPPEDGDDYDEDDSDAAPDDGGIMAGIAAARAKASEEAAAKTPTSSAAPTSGRGTKGAGGLTARQQAQRARRMQLKEAKRRAREGVPDDVADADADEEAHAASESEDDEWSDMLRLANEDY